MSIRVSVVNEVEARQRNYCIPEASEAVDQYGWFGMHQRLFRPGRYGRACALPRRLAPANLVRDLLSSRFNGVVAKPISGPREIPREACKIRHRCCQSRCV